MSNVEQYSDSGSEDNDSESESEEEQSNGGSSASEEEPEEEEEEEEKAEVSSNLPLFQRLAKQSAPEAVQAAAQERVQKRRRVERAKDRREEEEQEYKKRSKNAPAEMRSDKPVRRLRVTGNNSQKKTEDPRFSDISGKLDEKIFAKNYEFLDEYRDKEIEVLSKSLRKIKGEGKRAELKTELLQMKQQSKERKRGLRVMHRLDSLHREERQKVKEGKKPYFMKRAVVEHISLEERYKELRKEGKLGKFMEKRRKKDASKDRRWLPGRRGADE
mmetsp:Transcript_25231/g.54557  ORF Transcript_25231/g.54557 Transcript_25231/m.54557 type:complete len:273 (+) Transcript_25231:124-942(+)